MPGIDVAFEAFRQVDAGTRSTRRGSRTATAARPARKSAEVVGSARALLVAERTALNFLQRLSGIATLHARSSSTRRPAASRCSTRGRRRRRCACSRSTPSRAGGATNHRVGLFDAVLIKDNHVRLGGGVQRRRRRARAGINRTCRSKSKRRTLDEVDRGARRGRRRHPARQHVDRRHSARRSSASRGRAKTRDLRRRHARADRRSWRRPAPTSSRSARSRIRRRPSTSALKSSPSDPRRPEPARFAAAGFRGGDRTRPAAAWTAGRAAAISSPRPDRPTTTRPRSAREGRRGRCRRADRRPRTTWPHVVLAAGKRSVCVGRADAALGARRTRSRNRAADARGRRRARRRRSKRPPGLRADLKWPNDLLRGAAQAGGHSGGRRDMPAVTLGYGINVGPMAYPPELADRATSLETELGRAVDRAAVFAETLAALARRYGELLRRRHRCYSRRVAQPRSPGHRGARRFVDDAGRRVVRRDRGHRRSGRAARATSADRIERHRRGRTDAGR